MRQPDLWSSERVYLSLERCTNSGVLNTLVRDRPSPLSILKPKPGEDRENGIFTNALINAREMRRIRKILDKDIELKEV